MYLYPQVGGSAVGCAHEKADGVAHRLAFPQLETSTMLLVGHRGGREGIARGGQELLKCSSRDQLSERSSEVYDICSLSSA